MVVRIEYRGIPVRLDGEMIGGAFAATCVMVTEIPGSSWATEYERVRRRTAELLRMTPTHSTTLLGDLEWEATQWYTKQPTLAWRTVAGKKGHYYNFYCTDCGVPKGTLEAERVINPDDLHEGEPAYVCETCGEYVEMDLRANRGKV